ncbi:MAG: hypothetical protein JO356_12735 [Acidobacteria bacterium]|nr:hypothetical protein [Acidobacteriota bacterium]
MADTFVIAPKDHILDFESSIAATAEVKVWGWFQAFATPDSTILKNSPLTIGTVNTHIQHVHRGSQCGASGQHWKRLIVVLLAGGASVGPFVTLEQTQKEIRPWQTRSSPRIFLHG